MPALRVLVVDDDVDTAETFAEFLREIGHEARVAHEGVAAIALAGTFEPHVALLDVGLTGMSGYDLARELRPNARLRLIAVTGHSGVEDRKRCLDAGFDVHLTKPVDLTALELEIRER